MCILVGTGYLRASNYASRVEVHQVVNDLKGNLLVDKMVEDRFLVQNGLLRRFDILGI